jgi:hypothetical protein
VCLDYVKLPAEYPWFLERGHKAIVSPDSDGFLCGLFMSHHLGWSVVGYYDSKVLLLPSGISASDCIFLDMDIFRADIRSIGHHMLLYNKRRTPDGWDDFSKCLQPNLLRGFDADSDFDRKYPFGTIHLLMALVSLTIDVEVPESAICPLLFTDGTWMNLVKYTENSLDWIHYLGADEPPGPLNRVFCNKAYSQYELMQAMNGFLRARDRISERVGTRLERGDRLAITVRGGDRRVHDNVVLDPSSRAYGIDASAWGRCERFLQLLSELTGWSYDGSRWARAGFALYTFTKSDMLKGLSQNLGTRTFNALIESRRPLSFAITGSANVEFTLEDPDKLP